MEYEQLSLDELQKQAEEIAYQQSVIAQLLVKKREEGRGDFIRELRDLILERGYDLEDIASRLTRGARKTTSNNPVDKRRYVDPNDHERFYIRGPLPGWLKEQMQANGYDPASKEDRDRFKAERLTLIDP
ncbi:hypothetical protein CKO25_15220 [Thiocapsa imhoffii]|uniref:H-NS histone family protein n=1 Tax=Thiocapsa imhoffii TaxID=382777 RepID=A0A9X0WK64_9GAMM|nr:H-NS family nucleoid-associated regulatory protein [Thiocapsa imhoffii]MBK1645975.1 hypothetical protein [Thiocapsa imhoffii]